MRDRREQRQTEDRFTVSLAALNVIAVAAVVCLLAAVFGRRRRATRSTDGPALIARASAGDASKPEPSKLCYFLGRETVLGHGSGEMGSLAEGIFGLLQRNAVSAEAAFNIASRQAIKMGIQVGHCCLRKSPPALASTARAAGDALSGSGAATRTVARSQRLQRGRAARAGEDSAAVTLTARRKIREGSAAT